MTISIQQHSSYNHFEIVNLFSSEIKITAPSLYQDFERAKILEILLRKQNAVVSVQVVPDLAAVVIRFDPVITPQKNLLVLLETILANIGSKAGKTIQTINPYTAALAVNQENAIALTVTGMSCNCCALSLEMGLNRETEIRSANVDFTSATAKISGALTRQDAIDHIERLGYRVCVS